MTLQSNLTAFVIASSAAVVGLCLLSAIWSRRQCPGTVCSSHVPSIERLPRILDEEEFSVIIIGLDGAGKTTLLEKIKTLYNETPGLTPDKIGPTVGQNTGKITLPSTILQFWDLGGQRGIRNIWPKYYDDCHAVVYVIDAEDRERLGEGWEVFDSVLSAPQILGVPLLLLANKQDSPLSLSVEEIRNDYEDWHQRKLESARRDRFGETEHAVAARRERLASLDVMGVSALEGTGVRAAVDWLFLRVQNSRRDAQKNGGN